MRALIALIMLATVSPDIRSALAVVREGRDSSDLVSHAFAQFVANHLDSADRYGPRGSLALEHAAFLPGRIGDRAVSVCALLPFDFDSKP